MHSRQSFQNNILLTLLNNRVIIPTKKFQIFVLLNTYRRGRNSGNDLRYRSAPALSIITFSIQCLEWLKPVVELNSSYISLSSLSIVGFASFSSSIIRFASSSSSIASISFWTTSAAGLVWPSAQDVGKQRNITTITITDTNITEIKAAQCWFVKLKFQPCQTWTERKLRCWHSRRSTSNIDGFNVIQADLSLAIMVIDCEHTGEA